MKLTLEQKRIYKSLLLHARTLKKLSDIKGSELGINLYVEIVMCFSKEDSIKSFMKDYKKYGHNKCDLMRNYLEIYKQLKRNK